MIILTAAVLSAVSTLALAGSTSGEITIDWYTMDGGGAMGSTDGQPSGLELSGTIGQTDAGPGAPGMTGGNISLTGGFWVFDTIAPFVPCGDSAGDFDGDGDVDLVDFGEFQLCFTGGTGTLADGCDCADFDGDNDADLVDFGSFQLAFTGTSI
jgi:hypothetical protein